VATDHISYSEIPVVDLEGFRNGESSLERRVVDEVRRACEEIGFFVVRGHGVSQQAADRLSRLSSEFFDLEPDEKGSIGESGPLRGGLSYFPLEGESLAATLGEAVPADLKETLDWGPGFSGVPWPERPAGLYSAWLDYYSAMSVVAAKLRAIFALGLGLPRTHFDPFFDDHLSSLRVLNYPEQEVVPQPGQIRAGAHTDYGALTILRADAAPGGLQVCTRFDEWVGVPGVPDAFIVNIGDTFMRWTNDYWVSTLHRVVNPPSTAMGSARRQSIAFFHNPNRDALIECLPGFAEPDGPKYPPIRYKDYAELRYRQAHGEDKTLSLD
jgi:isopenicillin N synthase-like dioxygenase